MASFHEDFSRENRTSGPSDRSFGLVFTAVCLLAGVLPLRHGRPVRLWYLVASGVFLLASLARPKLLHYPNRAWLACGKLLGKVLNPIITALLFYTIFTPAGFILRLARKDPLGLRFDPEAKSYWNPRGSSADSSMANQF